MLCLSADALLFFPGFISFSERREPPGELLHGALPSRGEQICCSGTEARAGAGQGQRGSRVFAALQALRAGGDGEAAEGWEQLRARPRPAPPRPGRARPAPAPLCARSLSVVRALGRCQRGAPEGGRSAARGVWFRRGCEGGGQLWPWGSLSSTGGSRSGTPASARC